MLILTVPGVAVNVRHVLLDRIGDIQVIAFPLLDGKHADQEAIRRFFAHEFLEGVSAKGKVLIDMQGVVTLDSASLGPLVQKLRETQDQGGRLALCAIEAVSLREIFALTRFDKIFPIFHSRAEALKALQAERPDA